jgi:hypothetical protein
VPIAADGLQEMVQELKASHLVTAASIEAGNGSRFNEPDWAWSWLLPLGHRLQRSISRRLKKKGLPVSEAPTLEIGQHSYQRSGDCKFLQVCIGKGPYSTRMHFIDVCDKKTDKEIFRTLRNDYKKIRSELNSLLFKIEMIDFVEVSNPIYLCIINGAN